MSRVFVVQESSGKGFAGAQNFGVIVTPPLLPARSNIAFDSAPHVARMHRALATFSDEDYLLLIGDPAAIGLACAIAAMRNGGRYKCLKWDKLDMVYYPVQIDITVKGELADDEGDGSAFNQRLRRAPRGYDISGGGSEGGPSASRSASRTR